MSLCATSRVRAGSVSARNVSRASSVRVVASAQRPSAPAPTNMLRNAAGLAAAIALVMSGPNGPALAAERTPNNTPQDYADLPKDGPKSAKPGELQPADGIDVPRSNAKARIDAEDLSAGRTPAGQPRRISALPTAPSLYEIADLKSALGFDREVGDTDSAGSGAGARLQESAKEAFAGGADQAKDALQAKSGNAEQAINDVKDKAGNLVDKAVSKISALPSVPSLYEVADLKEALGFDREIGDTDSAGSGAGARLQESAKEAFAGGADQAQNKVQSLAGDVKSQAKDVANQAKDAIQSKLQ